MCDACWEPLIELRQKLAEAEAKMQADLNKALYPNGRQEAVDRLDAWAGRLSTDGTDEDQIRK